MSEALKACPFCGSEVRMCHLGRYWARCNKCVAESSLAGTASAVAEYWNRRPLEDAQAARIAEFEATLKNAQSNFDHMNKAIEVARTSVANRCAEIAESHIDCGEFAHLGRNDCVDMIGEEIRREFGLPPIDAAMEGGAK